MAAITLYVFIVLNGFVLFSLTYSKDEVKILDDASFEHLTQASTGATTGDWLIVFSRDHSECATCKSVEELMVKMHAKFQHKLNVAKVLKNAPSQLTLKRFEVTKWPSISLFHHGLQYFYTKETYDEESLTEFIEQYNKFVNRKVPEPISMFDIIIDDLMSDVKHIIRIRKNAAFVLFFSGVLFGLMLTQFLKVVLDFFISTFSSDGKDDENKRNKQRKDKPRKKDD